MCQMLILSPCDDQFFLPRNHRKFWNSSHASCFEHNTRHAVHSQLNSIENRKNLFLIFFWQNELCFVLILRSFLKKIGHWKTYGVHGTAHCASTSPWPSPWPVLWQVRLYWTADFFLCKGSPEADWRFPLERYQNVPCSFFFNTNIWTLNGSRIKYQPRLLFMQFEIHAAWYKGFANSFEDHWWWSFRNKAPGAEVPEVPDCVRGHVHFQGYLIEDAVDNSQNSLQTHLCCYYQKCMCAQCMCSCLGSAIHRPPCILT